MTAQSHQSDPRVLNRRSLERDHPRLARILVPGMRVLDVGCGSGSITAGIAKAVGPSGSALGIDRDESLLAIAREQYADVPNLAFERGDVLSLESAASFDVVTAARVLQWIADPGAALARMKGAVKPGGLVAVLDYTHEDNAWTPDPPAEFVRFYRAFLDWRAANGWDNRMAERLPALFREAGLLEVISQRTEIDDSPDLWLNVIESIGPTLVGAGFLSEALRQAALERYAAYVGTEMTRQALAMNTVEGRVPSETEPPVSVTTL